MSEQRTFPNDASAVRAARRFALEALGAVPPKSADAIALMVSELTANAVTHTSSHFTVVADRSEAQIRIAVSDDGDGIPEVQTPQPTETSGRGLQIVQQLATEWGVIPSADGRGKTVWFTYALPQRLDESAVGERSSAPAPADSTRSLASGLDPSAGRRFTANRDPGAGHGPLASRKRARRSFSPVSAG